MGVFPLFPLWQALCVKFPHKFQDLGLAVPGAGLAPTPRAFLGLQIPIPPGIPSLCPAELSLPQWIKSSTSERQEKEKGDY